MTRLRVSIRGNQIALSRPRSRLVPANDTNEILRGSIPELRSRESAILADIACGDIDERAAWQELALVRRSILASRGRGILRVA